VAAAQKGSSGKGTGSGAAPATEKKDPAKKSDPAKPAPSTPFFSNCLAWITTDPEVSSLEAGRNVHDAIRDRLSSQFQRQYGPAVPIRLPDASFDHFRPKNWLEIGNDRGGHGDVDLAFRSREGRAMLLGEVKPANWSYPAGEDQLKNYIDKANANDQAKATYQVQVFSPMLPDRFPLPAFVYVRSEQYEIRWCSPGMIVYKRVKKDKKEEEEKKRHQQEAKQSHSERAYKDQIAEQRKAATEGKALNRQADTLASKSRPLEAWTPDRLKRDIETASLKTGVYRDSYQAAWPGGHVTNVVVWVRGRDVEYYQEYPTAQEYWDWFAEKRGISARQADLVRRTLADYNRDMWNLIKADPVTQGPSSVSPYYARELLRYVYGERLRGVFSDAGALTGLGAAFTGLASAFRPKAPAALGAPQAAEEALPAWVNRAVAQGAKGPPEFVSPVAREVTSQGATEAVKNLERMMRVTP